MTNAKSVRSSRAGSGSVVSLGGVITVALVGGLLLAACGVVASIFQPYVEVIGGTLVPGANDGPPEAILLTFQESGNSSNRQRETHLVEVSTTTPKVLWRSATVATDLVDAPIKANATLVFTVMGQQLLALHRTNGSPAWQASLADKVSCTSCLQLAGTQVGAFSADGTLEVFDTTTGKSLWKVSAKRDSPSALFVLGQRLAIWDEDANNNTILRAFDPATGQETAVQPDCADPYSPVFMSPDASSFYLDGTGSGSICIQHWDTASLKQVWSTSPSSTSQSTRFDAARPLVSGDTFYLAGGQTVLGFSNEQGTQRTLVDDSNYAFNVLAVHGGDVILSAQTQRGTTHYAIWSVDATTGASHWKFDMGANPPLSNQLGSFDDHYANWTVQPADAGLRVVALKADTNNIRTPNHTILLQTLNWQTGQSDGQKSISSGFPPFSLGAPNWTVWKNDTLWMNVENELVAFDAAKDKVVYHWP